MVIHKSTPNKLFISEAFHIAEISYTSHLYIHIPFKDIFQWRLFSTQSKQLAVKRSANLFTDVKKLDPRLQEPFTWSKDVSDNYHASNLFTTQDGSIRVTSGHKTMW